MALSTIPQIDDIEQYIQSLARGSRRPGNWQVCPPE